MSKKKIIILSSIFIIYLSVLIATIKSDNINKREIPPIEKGAITINNTNYETLQAALDNVKENEIININKNIKEKIYAYNKICTINGNNNEISSIDYESESYMTNSILEFENCNIKLENTIINGNSNNTSKKANIGLIIKNSNIVLDNIQILNVTNKLENINDYPNFYSLYIINDEEENYSISINNLVVSNFHKKAIYINNKTHNSCHINMTDCKFNGIGLDNEFDQIAIDISGLIKGNINTNTFNNVNNSIYIPINNELIIQDNNYNNVKEKTKLKAINK